MQKILTEGSGLFDIEGLDMQDKWYVALNTYKNELGEECFHAHR